MKYHRAPAECAPAAASPPSRGAWIEIQAAQQIFRHRQRRPPSRGAWIEIPAIAAHSTASGVAPLAGGVD